MYGTFIFLRKKNGEGRTYRESEAEEVREFEEMQK